ncbi:MAG: hypothetical protein ACYC35_11730 [Pirellulales bacterium]
MSFAHAGGGAAAAAAIAQAIKASGAIVRLEPQDFEVILSRVEAPLVVTAVGGFFSTSYQYLTAYKGLVFYTASPEPLPLPDDAEVIPARRIWIPG